MAYWVKLSANHFVNMDAVRSVQFRHTVHENPSREVAMLTMWDGEHESLSPEETFVLRATTRLGGEGVWPDCK
jgi:hypothetical protein